MSFTNGSREVFVFCHHLLSVISFSCHFERLLRADNKLKLKDILLQANIIIHRIRGSTFYYTKGVPQNGPFMCLMKL